MAANFGNWQEALDNLVKETVVSENWSEFDLLKNDNSRIQFILSNKSLMSIEWLKVYLDNSKLFHQKSSHKALEYKNKGNQYFKKKDYKTAIQYYTESIIHAPVDEGQDLALAYGNRSAALYYLQYFQECLSDIQLAIDAGFPEESFYKLYQRRSQCYYGLKKFDMAESELLKAREYLYNQKTLIGDKKYGNLLKEMKELELNIIEQKKVKIETPVDIKCLNVPCVSYGNSDVITQASSAVDIKYNTQQGRYLVANDDIKAGDTLIVEKPYSSVLLPDHYTTHCHHCYKQLTLTVIGCRRCTVVRYCGSQCQQESWIQYHHIECSYIDLLHSVGIAHLSLRTILTAGLQFLNGFMKDNKDIHTNNIPGLNQEKQYGQDYSTVYNLLTHSEDMTSLDLYQYSLTATLLLVILIHSNWFHKDKDMDITTKHHDSATNLIQNKAAVNVDKLPSKSKKDSLDFSESTPNIDDKKALDGTCGTGAKRKMNSPSNNQEPNGDYNKNELKTSAKYVDALCLEESESEGICYNILGNSHDDDISSVKTRVSLSEIGIDKDMLNIGGLLLRHIQQLVCNAHAITELQASVDSLSSSALVDEMSQVRVATAIYPTASLMNHSCDPTIISSFQGNLLVVRAVKNVEKGEEIFNCYGPHFKRMIRSRRQEVLKTQYFFSCSCKPCTDGKKDDVQFDAMVCGKCKGCIDTQVDVPCCIDCGERESIHDRKMREEINTFYQHAMTSIDHSDLKGAMESLTPCLELCKKYLHKNNRLKASVEDSLARCYAMSGDYKKSLKHLENSIKVTELLYGDQSIELAYELQKMADILFNVKKPEKCLQIVNRAEEIFLIHFGENHETVKELNEMKVCLLEFINAKH